MWRSPWTWPWSKINFIHSLKFSTPNTHLPEISLQNDLFFTRPTKWNEPFHYVSFLLGFGAQNVTKDLNWDDSWEKRVDPAKFKDQHHIWLIVQKSLIEGSINSKSRKFRVFEIDQAMCLLVLNDSWHQSNFT